MKRLVFAVCLCSSVMVINVTRLWAAGNINPIIVGSEYDMVFEDGETIRNARVLAITEKEFELQIRGLTERIKVDKETLISARQVPNAPAPAALQKSWVKQWELQMLTDVHYGLAAFQSFDNFFPSLGLGVTAQLADRVRYLQIDQLHAESQVLRLTDGDRTIDMATAVVSSRWGFRALGIQFYAGAGAGMVALSLKSYTFSRTSYTYFGRSELGVMYEVSRRIRLNAGINGNYWQDNLETLLSISGQFAVGYLF